jgi:tetratricopeptide (TPR) repeat protein
MTTPSPLAQKAIDHARRGELEEALSSAARALAESPGDHGLTLFTGLLHARRMELDQAREQFEAAMRLEPRDPVARLELARVLIGLNRLDDAEGLLQADWLKGAAAARLQALLRMRRGQYSDAARLLEAIVAGEPRDFESWGNLGLCRFAAGDLGGAIEALDRSIALRTDQARFQDKWAEAHVAAGSGEQALRTVLQRAVDNPADPLIRLTRARLEDLLGRPDRAVSALEESLAIDPGFAPALAALAKLHERQNRLDEFAETISRLERTDPAHAELPLLRARLAYRRGELEQALNFALAAPGTIDPGSRAELLGNIHDRRGESAEAFAAFREMNRDTGLAPETIEARAQHYRSRLDHSARSMTSERVRRWPKDEDDDGFDDPVFLVGFPRSGTTLLDTLLSNHPKLAITEERPMLDTVARRIGTADRIAALDRAEVRALREIYFNEAAIHAPDRGDRLLVDKQPLAMAEAALIRRLFPGARFLFVERHPCDVVLSNFMARFEPTDALANFVTLEGAARLYDQLMTLWTRSRELLELKVHDVRYERLVADPRTELKAAIDFLGLPWPDDLLDNRSSAQSRGFINTPSYAQVAEPLYERAIGRWTRYREQMKAVLPLLEPWARRMEYDF